MRRLSLFAVLAVSAWQLGACGGDESAPKTDTAAPDSSVAPDTSVTPDTAQVDSVSPDTSEPDTSTPDTTEPDTSTPDTVDHDTSAPDTAVPDTATTDTAVTDTAVADTTAPTGFVVTKVDVCGDAGTAVGDGSLPFTDTDNTGNYANNYSYSQDDPCASIPATGSGSWGAASPDVVYAMTPAVSGSYSIVLDPTGFDPGMMVTTSCGTTDACIVTSDRVDFSETGIQEVVNVEMVAGTTYYVHIMGWDNTNANQGAYSLGVTLGEICDNDIDDNGDEAVDCADDLCADEPSCDESSELYGATSCVDGADNDGDGDTDCADDDCTNDPACDEGNTTLYPSGCTDAPVDNDGDGLIDCADPDCSAAAACDEGNATLYPNGCGNVDSGGAAVDDDGDGLANCADPDCAGAGACDEGDDTLYPGGCADNNDNDGDGTIDCDDADCALSMNCLGQGDTCADPFILELGVPATANTSDFSPVYGVAAGVCPGDTFGALGGGYGTGSRDVVYAFTPTTTAKYRFSLTQDQPNEGTSTGLFDNGLYITTDCANFAGNCLAAWETEFTPTPEAFTIVLQAGTTYFVIVDGWSSTTGAQQGAFTLSVTEPDPTLYEVACADGLDNEATPDTKKDCADVDCFFDSECIPEICTDGIDNDHDGLTDCDDDELGANGQPRCPAHLCIPEICDSGVDDDGDSLTDCADEECVMFVGDDPADTCAQEGELCDLPLVVNVDAGTNMFSDTRNLCTFHNGAVFSSTSPSTCKSTSATAGDIVYSITNGPEPKNVTVKATPTESYNLVLNVVAADADCSATMTSCVAAVDATSSSAETLTFNALPNTTYLVVVDLSSSTTACTGTTARNVKVDFTVQASETGACDNAADDDSDGLADCFDPDCLGDAACTSLGGSTCDAPFDITADVVITTNTCNYTADFRSGSTNGCKATSSTSTAQDFVVKFTAPHAGPYVAQLDAAFDSVFNVVKSDSCPATPLATCVGGIDTPDVGGKVTFNAAAAGEVFWIIVDGWGSGCGNVTFKITAQDAEIIYGAGACADTLDNDGNGLVDCYDPSCVVDATSCAGGLQGSTCASPIQTTELIGFSADTCLYSNDFKANSGAGCSSTSSSNTAKDLVIEFAAPAAGPYAVKLNAAFDSVMNVVAGNTAGCPASPITTCVGGVDTPDLGGKVSFTAQAAGDLFYIVVDGWGSSCGLIELEIVTVDPEAGSCADDVDNDLDGKIDCLDADCDSDPVCDESGYANGCGNDVDDDGDGKIDCADANCVLTADCNEASFTDGCTNTTDDDGDTKIDCADWNCKAEQASVCATPPGDVCGMADGEGLVVDTLPYLSTGLDTCDFAADHIINTGGGCTNHQESKDVVYAFTPMNDMTVAITLTAVDDTDDTVLNVSTVCAGNLALPTCVASDDVYFDDLLGDTGESVTIDVDAGTTYYIYVNGWGAADCAPYDLTVEEVQP